MQKKATWPEVAIKHGNTTKFGVPAFISANEWAESGEYFGTFFCEVHGGVGCNSNEWNGK